MTGLTAKPDLTDPEVRERLRQTAEAARAAGPNGMAELALLLLDEHEGRWAAGHESGVAEGRKISSTDRMFGVYRIFDPRPIAAARAAYRDAAEASFLAHSQNDPTRDALVAAVDDLLAAAEVPEVPKPGPFCTECEHSVYDHDANCTCTVVNEGPVLCKCPGYQGDPIPPRNASIEQDLDL